MPRLMSRTAGRGAVETFIQAFSAARGDRVYSCFHDEKKATATMPAPARNHHIGDTLRSRAHNG
jgi:hypothetical protein